MENKKKIIAAMSGGVDSSVVAAILKNRGYNVVGVFMSMGKHSNSIDARKVAKILNIPFYILNVQNEFKKRVVDYFIDEYKKGNTPNPCVECNKHIKFRFLIDMAMKLKADYVATGHYARIKKGKLLTAKDTKKDQTYFLWTLKQKQLKKILFPIGDYTKIEVRAMAKKFNLQVHDKQDSQEICFINTDIQDFLNKNIKAKSGDIITTEGKKKGKHRGLAFYTIGQRKRIKIGGIGPFYVVKKDFKNNVLIVGQSDFNEALFKKEMIVKNTNWLPGKPYFGKCKVKIRSMAKAVPARVMNYESRIKNCVKVIFNENQRAINPGQSAVFYLKDEVLGGGVIM